MNKVVNIKLGAYRTPEGRETKSDKYISWGVDNGYPDYLLTLFDRSAAHGAIVKGKVDYISGEGVVNQDGNEPKWRPNRFMNASEFMRLLAIDLEVFGGYAIQVIRRMDGKGVSEVYHLPFQFLRLSKEKDKIFYSEKWKERPKSYKAFERYRLDSNEETSVMYERLYSSGNTAYPKPEYSQGIVSIQTDAEIANWHLNNIVNGFSAGTMISFNNGIPTDEEQDDIVKQVKAQHGGSDNAGDIVVVFSDGQDRAPTILDLKGNDLDKKFEQLKAGVQEQIFVAHRVVSPMIFGVRTPGQLGGRSEMIEAYEMFKRTYIEPKQRRLIKALQYCAMIMGFSEVLNVIPLAPIGLDLPLSEGAINQALKVDELRQLISEKYGIQLQESQQTDSVDYEKKQAQGSLRGSVGGIQGIIDIVSQVNAGTIPASAAKEILIDLYGFEEATATRILAKTEEGNVMLQSLHKKHKHSKHDNDAEILKLFKALGQPVDLFEILDECEVDIASKQIRIKQAELSDIEKKALAVIRDNPKITAVSIAEALDVEVETVLKAIDVFSEKGFVRASDAGFETTSRGTKVADANDSGVELLTLYRYSWAAGFSDADLETSREFCREMLAENKLYSRQEIDSIENDLGSDVWATRGGWYHDPNRNVNLPYCRHVWKQVIVTRKK